MEWFPTSDLHLTRKQFSCEGGVEADKGQSTLRRCQE